MKENTRNQKSVHVDNLDLPDPPPPIDDGNPGPPSDSIDDPVNSSEEVQQQPWTPQFGDRVIEPEDTAAPDLMATVVKCEGESVDILWDHQHVVLHYDLAQLQLVWRPAVGDRVGYSDPEKDGVEQGILTALGDGDLDSYEVTWDDGSKSLSVDIRDLKLIEQDIPTETETIPTDGENIPESPENISEQSENIPSRWTRSNHTEMKTLFVSHSYDIVDEIEGNLASECLELEKLREEKRTADAGFNAKIKAKEAKVNKIAQAIADGGEQTSVNCTWYHDYTNSRAELRRDDTGAVIESRSLTADEVQLQLAIDEDKHPDDQEGIVVEASVEDRTTDQLKCNNCSWIWQVDGQYSHAPAVSCPECSSPAVSLYFEPGEQSDDDQSALDLAETLIGIAVDADIDDQVRDLDGGEDDENPDGVCRVCGCTEDNCQQSVEKTGEPCFWVQNDLCSACADMREITDDEAVEKATYRPKWEERALSGMTDAQIKEALGIEWGVMGGCGCAPGEDHPGYNVETAGGKDPKIWNNGALNQKRPKPIKGKDLIHAVRRVYNIGLPEGNADEWPYSNDPEEWRVGFDRDQYRLKYGSGKWKIVLKSDNLAAIAEYLSSHGVDTKQVGVIGGKSVAEGLEIEQEITADA